MQLYEESDKSPAAEDRIEKLAHGTLNLGLTITRQLVEAQGGVVTIESDEGLGTTFTMWLPLSAAASDRDVVGADRLHPVARPWAAAVDQLVGV